MMRERFPLADTEQIWAIVEGAHHPTFGECERLIGGKRKPGLDFSVIQQVGVFAPCDVAHLSQIAEDRSGAILAIEAYEQA